jgi:hypothetical protein
MFPIAIAKATGKNDPPVVSGDPRPPMYYVADFNPGGERWEVIGAYSKKCEAEAFAQGTKSMMPNMKPVVYAADWKFVVEQELRDRMGPIAAALGRSGAAPWPGEAWVIEDESARLRGVFTTEEAALKEWRPGWTCRSVDIDIVN